MDDPGTRTKGETIMQRLKREKLEEESQASKSREEIDQKKAESRRLGRDTFDRDLKEISSETLKRLVATSEGHWTTALCLPRAIGQSKFERLKSVLGEQLSPPPDNVSEPDFAAGYIERAKECWESEPTDESSNPDR
jgi:hypothetical protein